MIKKLLRFYPYKLFNPAVIILLVELIAYGNTSSNGFMLDDYVFLLNQQGLQNLSFTALWSGHLNGFYRPLGFLWMKLTLQLCGQNPLGYHLVNFILFYGVSLLFYILILRLIRNPEVSLFAVCLYTAHPINSFLINYKTAGYLILDTFFLQLSIFAFLYYLENKGKFYFLISIILYFLSLLCHEISFLLPLYIMIILYFIKNKSFKDIVSFISPYGFVLVIYFLIRTLCATDSFRSINPLFSLKISLGSYFASLCQLIMWYISKLILPWNILFLWDIPIVESNLFLLNSLFFIVLLGALYLILLRLKKGWVTFSLAFLLAGFTPMGLASFTYAATFKTVMVETFWFSFSSIGYFLLIALGLNFFKKFFKGKIWVLFLIIIICTLAMITRNSNRAFKDEKTYCLQWIKLNPFNETPWDSFSKFYNESQSAEVKESILKELENFFWVKPNYLVYKYRGTIYLKIGRYSQALDDFNKSIELNPNLEDTYNNRAVLYSYYNQYDKALGDLNKSLAINPQSFKARNNRGYLYFMNAKYGLALIDFDFALKVNPHSGEAYYNRSLIYQAKGNLDKALQDALMAQALGVVDLVYIDKLKAALTH